MKLFTGYITETITLHRAVPITLAEPCNTDTAEDHIRRQLTAGSLTVDGKVDVQREGRITACVEEWVPDPDPDPEPKPIETQEEVQA